MDFAKTKDGHDAVTIGRTVYAILPHNDRLRIAHTMSIVAAKPESVVKEDLFHHAVYQDRAAAVAELEDLMVHAREEDALGRHSAPSAARTPWGKSQGMTVYAEGVAKHSTAGHGGIKLDRRRNARVHELLRNEGGWYEEDQEAYIVVFSLPELFTARERRKAEAAVRNFYPDQFEQIRGVVLAEGESISKDKRAFFAKHAQDWIVTSAIGQDDGTTHVYATIGGEGQRYNGPAVEEKRFVIPKGEYDSSGFGFVIDPSRHEEIVDVAAAPSI